MDDFTSSHRLRLTLRQWAGVGVFTLLLVFGAPRVWPLLETFETPPAYRIPYALSQDYGLWSRWAERAVRTGDTLVLGDSVVWGQYARPGETLPAHLSALSGKARYANLGVNGMQPAVLAGLIEHYGKAIRGRDVILQCNPLWMSSPKHDLREDEAQINHAQLLPQFRPSIPGYKDEIESRLSRIVDRNLPFRAWTNHLQVAYFESESIPAWTRRRPGENPLARLTLTVPPPEDALGDGLEPISWVERGAVPVDFPWMALEESFQFTRFLRALEILRARGNRVTVVLGPFNEHLCKGESLGRYAKLRDAIAARLRGLGVPTFVPAALPSEAYGDASHPLSKGYEILARQLLNWTP